MIFNESKYNHNWSTYSLSDLGSFSRGKSKHRPRNDVKLFEGGKIPFVQTAEIKASNLYIDSTKQFYNEVGLMQSKLWPKNTLCITIAANIADVALLSFPSCFPDSVVGFNANEKTTEKYMYYLFCYISNEIKKRSTGSTQDNINIDYLTSLKFKIPPKNYQNRIVELLYAIDSKIENNKKLNFELESMAKTLYDYWFLQFEFPNKEGKTYKSSGGKMVWNEELKRDIPEGWEVKNLMDNPLCKNIKAGVDKFDKKNYLPTANIDGESITDGEYVTFDNREGRANMQPVKYSVWFAKMKNSIKHLSISERSNWFTDKYILSTGFQGLKCNEKSFAYIHCIVNSGWFEKYKDKLSHGATQESVNDDDLKNVKFTIPSDNILEAFSKIVNPILEKKFSVIRENQELSSLRDFLLPLLMNGQVTFKNCI